MTIDNRANARTVRIYACGGGGINICSRLQDSNDSSNYPGFALVRPTYIDTSVSNAFRIKDDLYYKIQNAVDDDDNIDGNGKVRGANIAEIRASLPDILLKHAPGDLNIVVHTTSGGSGSTIGPVLVSELLRRGESVLTVLVGSTDSIKEIENSVATLKTYESISQTRKRPVCAMYSENGVNGTMAEVDKAVLLSITTLMGIWSGQNTGLDSRDLNNLLDYHAVTDYEPGLTLFSLVDNTVKIKSETGHIIVAMGSLITEGQDPTPPIQVGYHTYGTATADFQKAVKFPTPIRMVLTIGPFFDTIRRKEKIVEASEAARQAAQSRRIDVSGSKAEDDGVIF